MSEPITVVVREGDCPCPGTPHEHEEVYLEPRLTTPIAVAALAAIRGAPTKAAVLARLTETYLALGIRTWTFTDAEGRVVPVTDDSIEVCIPWSQGGGEVANKLDELFSGDLFRPLAVAQSKSSPPTSTEPSTSATSGSGSTHPKPPRRSSPNGSAGKVSVVPGR